MSAVGWGGGLVGWRQAGAIESQISEIEEVIADVVVATRISAIGSAAGASVASGATVRFPFPSITERFPDNAQWTRTASGLITYDGALSGVYEVHCPVAFGTSVAVVASYTFSVVEGTGLDTGSPVIRDSATFTIERQLLGINTTAAITGLLNLLPGGGELALRVSHNQGVSVTVTPATIALLAFRVSQRGP